jgi:uncharacterized protein (TIGR02270 family)
MTPNATTRARFERPIIPVIVQQHAEEAAMLRHIRSVLVRAPHVALLHLGRLDERIAAHLDGLAVAGPAGMALCVAALERPGAGEVFALAVRALESGERRAFEQVLALAATLPDAARGLASALGWVSNAHLRGVVSGMLASPQPHRRALGLAACRMHQVDPGPALRAALADHSAEVRAAALHCAAALGHVDLRGHALQSMADEHPEVVFRAAWAACLLGDRRASLRVLRAAAQQSSPYADCALTLAMAASPFDAARELARDLSLASQAAPADLPSQRRLVYALGLLGDVRFVPWLIERMATPALARLAGQSFSWISGADLARMDLETLEAPARPEHPSDDPADDDVALDEDESLPWPDRSKIEAWWQRQTALSDCRERLFDGEPVALPAARRVLHEGTQRRRGYAALCACLLQPGLALFPVAAPAPRQRRWLARLG